MRGGGAEGPGAAGGQRWVLRRLRFPPGSHFVAVPALVPGPGVGPEQSPARASRARRGAEGRGAGGGLHATVGNVLPRPPRLPIDRDKHANEFLCMSLAYRQIAGGGAAVCALQRALMQHPNSHCGALPPAAPAAPRAPRRGHRDPHRPLAPPGPPGHRWGCPGWSSLPGAAGHRDNAGINKAKPGEAALLGLFLCFHLFFCVLSPCAGREAGGGPSATASRSPAPAAAVN